MSANRIPTLRVVNFRSDNRMTMTARASRIGLISGARTPSGSSQTLGAGTMIQTDRNSSTAAMIVSMGSPAR